MSQGNFKNMVILKNLPSNIVEEAIVILKSNKRAKRVEKIEKNRIVNNNENKKREKDYFIKEAELLISNYISNIEKRKKDKILINKKINKKYFKIRNYAIITSLIILVESIVILIK